MSRSADLEIEMLVQLIIPVFHAETEVRNLVFLERQLSSRRSRTNYNILCKTNEALSYDLDYVK